MVFNMFPVYMKVFEADSGSSLKPKTASWAATKALVVLILRSRVKSLNARERGSSASLIVAAPADIFRSFPGCGGTESTLTVINYHAGKAERLLYFRKDFDHRLGV